MRNCNVVLKLVHEWQPLNFAQNWKEKIFKRSAPPEKKKLTRPQRKHQDFAPKVRPAASWARDWFDPRPHRRKGVPYSGRGA